MEYNELKAKSPEELKDMATGFRKEMFNLRVQRATGEAAPQARFRSARKDLARVMTALSASKSGKAETAAPKAKAKKGKK